MTKRARNLEAAALAAGEPLPGTTHAEPTPESRDLERLVLLMRGAQVSPSEARRAAVLERVKEQPARRFITRPAVLIAASVLVVMIPVAAWLTKVEPRVDLPPPGEASSEVVFSEVFQPRTWEPTDPPPITPPPAGIGDFGPSFLRPFADQVEFPLLVPVGLPRELLLVSARYRPVKPRVRSFPFLWLEFSGPMGRLIVLEARDGLAASDPIDEPDLPAGWRSTARTIAGVRAVVASPDLAQDVLDDVAVNLVPFDD